MMAGLRGRILLLTALAIILVSLLGLGMVVRDRAAFGRAGFHEEGRSIAEALVPMLRNSLVVGDLATVKETFDSVVERKALGALRLLDGRTRATIVAAEDVPRPEEAAAPAWFRSLVGEPEVVEETVIQVGGLSYGILRVEMSSQALMLDLWSAAREFLLLGLAGLAGILAVLGLVLRQGLAPLDLLVHGARRAAGGDLEQRIGTVDVAEFAEVAEAFDQMAEAARIREEDLRRAQSAAEAGARTKASFVAAMGHQVRTPLNGIMGMTELALATEPSREQRHYLELIRSSADNLLSAINEILDFSRLESGQLILDRAIFPLRETVDAALAACITAASAKGLALECHLDPELPSLVHGDPLRLRQVLAHLIENGIRFTPQGRISVRVDPVPGVAGTLARFSVADSGLAIPADKLARVFEPFAEPAGVAAGRHGAGGLGLAISHQLVRKMGGELTVANGRESGCVFSFVLPLERASAAVEERPRPLETDPGAIAGTGHRILVAEDAPVTQTLIMTLLRKRGYRPVLAVDGGEAVTACRQEVFDLILMDLQMPVLDGLAATARIREWEISVGRHTPIVAITANAFEDDRRRCEQAGMDDFIAKPFKAQVLYDTLDRYLKSPA